MSRRLDEDIPGHIKVEILPTDWMQATAVATRYIVIIELPVAKELKDSQ